MIVRLDNDCRFDDEGRNAYISIKVEIVGFLLEIFYFSKSHIA